MEATVSIRDRNRIAGKRFGRLVVIERTTKKYFESYMWNCQCDCGGITYSTRGFLLAGQKASCGCLHRESASKNITPYIEEVKRETDLTGCKVGLLEVLDVSGQDKHRNRIYYCSCKCGAISFARRRDLLRRKPATISYPKSCGCRGKSLIERHGDQWRMISTGEIVPLDLHIEAAMRVLKRRDRQQLIGE